ncbi:MAG: histidine kinase [Alphaproteobacteria bacterium]|nr:histidine kinase [Alphaproteobacteria bacterium]
MRWGSIRYAAVVVAAWTLVALAWTPPTFLVQSLGGPVRFTALQVFADVWLSFVPWMAATPLIFALGRRYALSEGRIVAPLAVHIAAGIVLVPVVTALGVTLSRLAMQVPAGPLNILGAVLITAFYSVPTYVAAVAVGQALAFFERYRLRERLLARAELRALQAQLNPHFLFNALNAISALGYRDAERADEALTKLAAILRISLQERPELVALKDEIAFAQDYLGLYALLLPGRTMLMIEVEPAAWDAAVPALLLQPLVENALLHGLAKLQAGRLKIAAKRDGDRLSLNLHNDAPRDAAPSDGKVAGSGIGLANTRERLRVLFGGAARMRFVRNADDALIEIDLPYREAEP